MDYLKLVEELNQELYDNHKEVTEVFYYTSSGFVDVIGFGEIVLWQNADDVREWVNGDYEPLKPYLKMSLREYGEKLIELSEVYEEINTSKDEKRLLIQTTECFRGPLGYKKGEVFWINSNDHCFINAVKVSGGPKDGILVFRDHFEVIDYCIE